MNSIGERIRELRNSNKISQKKLAKLVGVSASAVSQWERGDTEPRGKHLSTLSKVLDTTIEWLTMALRAPVQDLAYTQPSCVLVPFYPSVRAAGGDGEWVFDEEEDLSPIPVNVLRNRKIENVACISVTGNSMEPVVPHGSIVAFDRKDTYISDGKIYVFRHNGLLRIKSLKRTPFSLIITSYNPDYTEEVYSLEELNSEEFELIGKVFWMSVEV